ncbi:MAG: TonB-dependent receptor [Dysgonamonadaceae bacterium]|jgi:TonB-linked SusC/RagA family outer membrane protein|nr:TonB-dependent receptor [Dysgonamonadaceae bacterium]
MLKTKHYVSILCSLLFIFQDVSAQKAELLIDFSSGKATTLKELLDKIEKESGYTFVFNSNIDVNQPITITVEQETVSNILKKALTGKNITYDISGQQIVLKSLKAIQAEVMNLSGIVTDDKGEPVIGAFVVENGTKNRTVTDIDGRFKLDVSPNATLIISYLGYKTQEIVAGKRTNISVILSEDAKVLEDVVVIGYGTMKKRDLTGAISSVKSEDLNLVSTPSIGHVLQGKAAGLAVVQNSAQPGGGLDILIRGAGSVNASNRPLYIVDGFPITVNDAPLGNTDRLNQGTQGALNFLNPNDISSIEVLKDASATAIYGARAANGVVLITTKRGKEGKPIVNFSASYALQKHTDIYDVFGLKEWMHEKNNASWDKWMFENDVYPYGNRTLEQANALPRNGVKYKLPYTDSQIDAAGEGTDWIKLVTRDGSVQQYNVSVQGGNEDSKYLISANYYDHNGIVKNSRMQRYSGKTSFDHTLSKYFKMSLDLVASRLDYDNTPLGDGQWEKSGLIRAALQMGPHIPARLDDGTYPVNPELPQQPNPYSLLEVTDQSLTDRLIANTSITAEPVKDLLLKVHVGLDRSVHTRNTYMPESTLHGSLNDGIATMNTRNQEQYLAEATVNYNFSLHKAHRISLLLGHSVEKFKTNEQTLGNNGFITDGFLWNNLASGEGTRVVGSNASENLMVSYFGRLNYSLWERYLLTTTLRSDGASVFARNHKYGIFPSVALGWHISEEKFMDFSKKYLDMLKLRVSYGQTGNAEINTNAFAAYYPQIAYGTLSNDPIVGVFLSRLENPDLKWETTTEFNIGLDMSWRNGRITTSFEYYDKIVSDLLNMKELNSYHDVSVVMANIGKTQSRGFEATINTKNILQKNFSWSSDFTFTTYKDRWLERTPDWKPSVYMREDDPIRPIYSRVAAGILQTDDPKPAAQTDLRPGQIIISDINGYQRDADGNLAVDANGRFLLTGKPDGIIDDADTQLLGNQDPGFVIGFSNQFRYRNFDFGFHCYGMFDRIMMNQTYLSYGVVAEPIAQYGYNALREVKNVWTPENPSTTHPSSFYGYSQYGYGDFFYEKAWFIRLQDISLGYTLQKNTFLHKVFSNLRVHLDVNNVFVITPYSGLDPETDAYTAAYPNSRTFTFGVDITF